MYRVLWHTRDLLLQRAQALSPDKSLHWVHWTHAFSKTAAMYDENERRWLGNDEWEWDFTPAYMVIP